MKNLTDITIVLDRSGSMRVIKEATIKGFNAFLKEQQKTESNAVLSLVQFDQEYKIVYENININEAKKLTHKTFEPRGFTALLDAIGVTINNTKNRIKTLEKKQRPNNVLIVIITDGLENSSIKYTKEKVLKKIRKRERKDNWQFIYMGANQNAVDEGRGLGIIEDRALTFIHDNEGAMNAFSSLSQGVCYSLANEGSSFEFTDNDRDIQKRE